jgi:ATP-dependent Lon protease
MIMPAANKKDLIEIPKKVIRDIEFIFVEDVREVFKEAMVGPLGPARRVRAKAKAKKARKSGT